MTLLAKSDGTTLAAHTSHVVEALLASASALMPELNRSELETARHGAILHDLGKAHPDFQIKLKPGYVERSTLEMRHRHELSSLLFLPLFARDEWPQLIDMVVAHHKSVKSTASNDEHGLGLLDLVSRYSEEAVLARHAGEWDMWHPEALEILPEFGIVPRTISLNEARDAFREAVEHCSRKKRLLGRNRWRGLLMSSDHLASALQEGTVPRLSRLFQVPPLNAFHKRADEAEEELYPLARMPVDSPKPHTLVIAPTGAGKTDYLVRRCRGTRIFYVLPFQASINAMFRRFNKDFNGSENADSFADDWVDLRRIHAASQIEMEMDGAPEETILQRHTGAAVKVMTPHQLGVLLFGLAGHEAMALDLAGQSVILDEVHVYSEQTQAMVLELVKCLVRLGCHVHIGSATIPTALADEVRSCLGGDDAVSEIHLTEEQLRGYDRHVVVRLEDEASARERVRQSLADGKRVLLLSNRVVAAQERYRWATEAFPGMPVLLVHSRFRRCDRAEIEQRIQVFDKMPGPCLVCSTQVIEVSLDISFDTMVTDCAPLDSLVQRFGRVNRRRVPPSERTLAEVAVIAPPDSDAAAKPYSLDVLRRTWDALPESGGALHETCLQGLIDRVYPELDLSEIDTHLRDLPELRHRPKSDFLEFLEIDSEAVVRACDAAAYEKRRDERQELEIPVPSGAIRAKTAQWPQSEYGRRPYLCPDECYDADLGLLLGKEWEPKCIIL